MDEQENMKKRIKRLEDALQKAKAGFELIHERGMKGFTEDLAVHCVHQKGAIDRVLSK